MNIEPPEKPPTTDETPIPPSTPQNVGASLGGTGLTDGLGAWESPAFLQRSRTSFGCLVDTPLDPFVEEDGFVPGKGRKRPRFSMRSSDWRVIDEPESPQEKVGAVDWMEMFEDEISEPEVEDKSVAGDVEAVEPPANRTYVEGAEELPNFTESQEIPTFHPVSEPREAPPEPEPEQVVGPSVQLVEPDTEQHQEPADHDTGAKEHINPFMHLPTDTPRLHPIPSPGLPIPSPLVTTNNSNGYFSSFTTSTTQTPTGPLSTTQTQTTIRKVEARVGPQMQPATLQVQSGPFGTGINEEGSHLSEHVPETQGFGIDARISEPTTMDETAEPQDATNTEQIEGLRIAPEHDKEVSQSETIAERALQAQGSMAEDIVEYSETGPVTDDRDESDVDQAYSENDESQDEDEWSEGQESEEDIDEQEQSMDYQGFQSKTSHDGSQIEVINLDSDEGEETMERHRGRDASIDEDDQYSSMEDNIDDDDDRYLEDEAGEGEMEDEMRDEAEDEAEEDDELGDEGDEVPTNYEATPADLKEDELQGEEGAETAVDKDEAMSANFEADESEDDEDLEDEEVEDDYEAENERRTGYDAYVGSDLGSEEFSEEEEEEKEEEEAEYQRPSPPKNVQPEVIVLDSDSDEENPSTTQAVPAQREERDINEAQETEPHMPPADEYSVPSEGSFISEAEDMAASAKEEYFGDEVSEYEQMEEEQLEEGPMDKDQVAEGRMKEEQAVEEQMGIEEAGDVEVEDKAIEDEQTKLLRVRDARAQDEQTGDKPMDDEQVEDGQLEAEQIEEIEDKPTEDKQTGVLLVKDEQEQDRQIEDDQVEAEDEPMENTWNESANAPVQTDSDSFVPIQENPILLVDEERPSSLDPATNGLGLSLESSARQPSAPPEPTTDAGLAIDPNILESTLDDERPLPKKPTEQEMDYVEVRQPVPERFPEQSDQHDQLEHPVWVDGANDSKAFSAAADKQVATPDGSQDVGVSHQFLPIDAIGEAPLTPQYTQEELLHSTLQHQLYASASASKDALSSAEHSPEPDSFVIAQEDVRDAPAEDMEAQGYPGKDGLLSGENDGDRSPEVPERYFSPTAGSARDALSLRTKLTGLAPLAALADNIDSSTDTISVVCEVSSTILADSEKSEQVLTFQLTDPSMAGTPLLAQITRPYNETLPQLAEGDAILLRNFKVHRLNRCVMIASRDTSSWTVFRGAEGTAQIAGPLAEYNADEHAYASGIRQWYYEVGAAMVADNQLQASIEVASLGGSPASSALASDEESIGSPILDTLGRSGSPSVTRRRRRKRKHRKITIHELRDGRRYAQVGSPSDKGSIHQLRDGTVYANL